MELTDLFQMSREICGKPLRQHGQPILAPFPVTDLNLSILEVEILDPKPQAFEETQARAVEFTARGKGRARRVTSSLGSDARQPDAGDAVASSRKINAAGGPRPPQLEEPGVCARWTV